MRERAGSPRTSPIPPPSASGQPTPPRPPRLFQLGGQAGHFLLEPRPVGMTIGHGLELIEHASSVGHGNHQRRLGMLRKLARSRMTGGRTPGQYELTWIT